MMFAGWIEETFDVRAAAARDILAYWLALALAVATVAGSTGSSARSPASRSPPSATIPRPRSRWAWTRGRMKWFVFLTSAFGTGLAGGLIYLQKARISPDAAFSLTDWTAYVIFIVVIGGIGTIEGPIIGVIVFFVAPERSLRTMGRWYLMILGLIGIASCSSRRAGSGGSCPNEPDCTCSRSGGGSSAGHHR
jgi:branched-chain amino acid transport system permease protein